MHMDRSVQTFGLRRGGGGGISETVIPFMTFICAVEVPAESVLLMRQQGTISWAFTVVAIFIFLFQKCE